MKKHLGSIDIFSLAFGAMIGWGWVILTQQWILQAGVLGSVMAFVAGGLIVFGISLTYAELTSVFPFSGGEHFFSYRGLGLHASFLCTWAMVLGYLSVVAFEAVAFPAVLESLWPEYFKTMPLWTIGGETIHLPWVVIGVCSSLAITAINLRGVKNAAFLQNILTLLLVGIGVVFIAGTFLFPKVSVTEPHFTNFGFSGFTAVLMMTPFMFVGFDVIPQTAEEIELPKKRISQILLLAVVLAVVWYVCMILATALMLPIGELQNAPLATANAMQALFASEKAKTVLIFAGLAGIITSWNSFFIGGTRALHALAEGKMIPESMAKINKKRDVPSRVILTVGLITSLAPFFGKQMMVWLVNAGGLAITITWFLVSLSFVVLRFKEPGLKRPFAVKRWKLVGGFATISSLGLISLYFPIFNSGSALKASEWAIVLGWFASGALVYGYTLRKTGTAELQRKIKSIMTTAADNAAQTKDFIPVYSGPASTDAAPETLASTHSNPNKTSSMKGNLSL